MGEFLGFGGYQREAEGFMSWQHLTFVTALMVIMVGLAVWLGRRNRFRDDKKKNKVLIFAAIAIDAFEIFKIVIMCWRGHDPLGWLGELPLYLCSIQLITIPLAAFSKGKIKEASLDFVFIFGILGALLGTYGAAQNYNCYPVLSMDNVVSGITHAISGFASLYIVFSGMQSMKKKNMFIVFGILISFCIMAYSVDMISGAVRGDYTRAYNYMFLMRGDGTPYDIFYNMVNGNKVAYPLVVVGLFLFYISMFYLIYFCIKEKKFSKKKKVE